MTAPSVPPGGVPNIRLWPGGKDVLAGVSDTVFTLIVRAALGYLVEHPDTAPKGVIGAAHAVWEAVRGLPADALGTRIEAALLARFTTPGHEIGLLIGVLLRGGDLRRTLLVERGRIDAILDALARNCEPSAVEASR